MPFNDAYITIVFLAFFSIVHSFETVGSVFAQQLENGDSFSVMTDSILFVAEHVSWGCMACHRHVRIQPLCCIANWK